jgi:crotonobetaine/carnitine-CoA ligase
MTKATWLSEEQTTIPRLLDARLAAAPDDPYIDVCGTAFTAAEVATAGYALANTYSAFGLRPGDRVASVIENSPEALLAWWGAVSGGFVAVPINTAYKG